MIEHEQISPERKTLENNISVEHYRHYVRVALHRKRSLKISRGPDRSGSTECVFGVLDHLKHFLWLF